MMRWMRRSRFVARESAKTRRDDTYSPAAGNHTSHLIPLAYLHMLAQVKNNDSSDAGDDEQEEEEEEEEEKVNNEVLAM